MKKVPFKIKRNNKEYILEKVYPNYALYIDCDYGIRECFLEHDLDLLEEMIAPPKVYLNPEKTII